MSQTPAQRERDSTQEVTRGDTDARLPPPNSFTIHPPQWVIDAFIEHVRETGEPETFPSITTTTPPKNSPVRFIKRLPIIDRKKRRDGQEAPCAICSPTSPKFIKNGVLAWYPEEGAIRAIGPECGDTLFGGNHYAQAFADLKKREHEDWLVDFLTLNLTKLVSILAALNALEEAAIEALRLYKQLHQRVPRILKKLREIKRQGGHLIVTIVQERRGRADDNDVRAIGPRGITTRDSEYDAYDERFGQLPETTALLTHFDPVAELNECRDALLELPRPEDEEAAFNWVCNESPDPARLEETVRKLRKGAHGYLQIASRLDSFMAFFDPSLFDALDRWGSHPENDFQLSASAEGGRFHLKHQVKWFDKEEVVLRPDFEKLRKRGQLPGFDQP